MTMPVPLIVNVWSGCTVIVNAFDVNTIPFTSISAPIETPVLLDEAKVAVSDAPLGTVVPVQLLDVFQFELLFPVHVALPAKAGAIDPKSASATRKITPRFCR